MRRPGDRDEAETEASDNPQDTGSPAGSSASSASSGSSASTPSPLAPPPALPARASTGAAEPAGPVGGTGKPPLDRGGLVNLLARVREHLAREHEGPHRLTVVQHRLVLDRLAGAGMIAPIATCPRAEQLEAVVETVCEVVGVETGVVEGCL